MTCFWDGIVKELLKHKLIRKYVSAAYMANFMKQHVIPTCDVTWNGEILTRQLLYENFKAIYELNVRKIGYGYFCSSCDPFLLLLSQLYKVHIDHNYNGTLIKYRNIKNRTGKTLKFGSNRGHFWAN